MSTTTLPAPKATRKPKSRNVSPFTRSQAEEICRIYDADEDMTYAKLAEVYGVREVTIGRVLRGEIKNFAPEEE